MTSAHRPRTPLAVVADTNGGTTDLDAEWRSETVIDGCSPEHQYVGSLMWLTGEQARPWLELVPDTAIWRPQTRWAYVMYRRTLFSKRARPAPEARLRRLSAVPANLRDRAFRSGRARSEHPCDVVSARCVRFAMLHAVIDKEVPR